MTGLDDNDRDVLIRTWDFISKRKPARIVNDQDTIEHCRQIVEDFWPISLKWLIRNIFEIQHGHRFLYLVHIEVDLGYSGNHKYGFRDQGTEYRLWCISGDFPLSMS